MIKAYQSNKDFSTRLLSWFEKNGRHNLPWQYHHQPNADIYAVWLSEIMLQQTQVTTVLRFFERFIVRFPTVQSLAAAEWDEVAQLWAGLGYYARARNLHQGAKQLSTYIQQQGNFPQTMDEWQTIKGVGRSTAGAVVAMGVRGFGVICDGNVKRVLTRHYAIDDDINKAATDRILWQLATQLTPKNQSGKYAQAIMDLGATICTKNQPQCDLCPIHSDCQAKQFQTQQKYPVKSKPKPKPHRHSLVIQLEYEGKHLWLKRPSDGKNTIWAGLWCLPLATLSAADKKPIDTHDLAMHNLKPDLQENFINLGELLLIDWLGVYQNNLYNMNTHNYLKHSLTHFHWHLYLLKYQICKTQYQQISNLLATSDIQFQWTCHDENLAKPAAMQKLIYHQ